MQLSNQTYQDTKEFCKALKVSSVEFSHFEERFEPFLQEKKFVGDN